MFVLKQMLDIYQITGGAQANPITPQMLYQAAPMQGKSEANKQIEENQQQAAQAAQMQQQMQQQILQTQSQAAQAKAISDVALSKERFTRAVANMGLSEERTAQSVHDRSMAALERAKAIKELATMDDARLMKYLEIVQMMEGMAKQEEEKNKIEDVAITEKSEQLNAAFPQVTQQSMENQAPEQPNQPIGVEQ